MSAPMRDIVRGAIDSLNLSFPLKDKQLECINHLLNKKDVLAVLPTGYGKSIIYSVLPQLWKYTEKRCTTQTCIVLVISPLVSLMKDQVSSLRRLDIDSVYLGDSHSEERMKMIRNGEIPLLLMSPESLFSGDWRDIILTQPYQEHLHTIVIDECHCVEQWGTEFRTDYSRLSELRSLIPNANMLALTATATPNNRKKITEMLCMLKFEEVITSCDRPNIKHVCIKSPSDIKDCFLWLCNDLKNLKEKTPKVVIYCRNIKSCGLIYEFLMGEIGVENSYIGTCSSSNCLYAMYHHSTTEKIKTMIVDSFCKVDSTLRIVIATTAFGMGVNVPNINIIVHWGAPHNIQGYMQQSGRAGRDGTQSLSIIYYHPSDISTVATDTQTREFCLLQSCRRKFLIQQFTPEAQSSYSVLGSCLCCDNCKPTCRCGACLLDPPAIIEFDESLTKFAQLFDETIMREVHDQQRTEIKDELLHLRTKLVGNSCASLLNVGMITGLSDKVINDIVTNVHYIFSIDDIMSQYVFERKTAGEVFDIIDNVLSD